MKRFRSPVLNLIINIDLMSILYKHTPLQRPKFSQFILILLSEFRHVYVFASDVHKNTFLKSKICTIEVATIMDCLRNNFFETFLFSSCSVA